jgi:hypothetical protein
MLNRKIAEGLGITSFALLLVQLFCAFVLVIMGFQSGPGGHPPGGAMGVMYAIMVIVFVAPFALFFGLFGVFCRTGKWAVLGALGNLGLMVAAQWSAHAFLGARCFLWASFLGARC